MKKIIVVIMAIIILAAALAGCVQKVNVVPEISNQPEESTPTPTPTPTPTLTVTPALDDYHEDDGDWVYHSVPGFGLCKFRPDGTEMMPLMKHVSIENFIVLENWIYYRIGGYGEDSGLYRIRSDGTENAAILPESTYDHKIFGDWIYYLEGFWVQDQIQSMYKCRLDGTEKTLLKEIQTQSSDARMSIKTVSDGWIYYDTTQRDGDGNYWEYVYTRKICRTSIDGSKTEVIFESDNDAHDEYMYIVDIIDNCIYYMREERIDNKHEQYGDKISKIYKTSIDGKETEVIFESKSNEYLDEVRIYEDRPYFNITKYEEEDCYDNIIDITDDWIYHIAGKGIYDSPGEKTYAKIYRISKEGSKTETIFETNEYIDDIHIYGDWVYFGSHNAGYDWSRTLKKVNVNGGKTQILLDKVYISEMFISDNWIYFTDVFNFNNIYKITTDGTDRTKLNNDEGYDLYFYEDTIYYTVPYCEKIPGTDVEGRFEQLGNYLYKIDISGKDNKKIDTFEFERDETYYNDSEKTTIKKWPEPDHKGIDITKLAGKKMSEIIKELGKKYTVKKDKITTDYGKSVKAEVYEYKSLGLIFYKLKSDKYPLRISVGESFFSWEEDGSDAYNINDKVNIEGYGLDSFTNFENTEDIIALLGKPKYIYEINTIAGIPDATPIWGYELQPDIYLEFQFLMDHEQIVETIRITSKK